MLLPVKIRQDLQDTACLAASLVNAHTAAIFIPTELTVKPSSLALTGSSTPRGSLGNDSFARKNTPLGESEPRNSSIDLLAVHSYAKLARDCRIPVGSGLIGWVADQGRPIHLAPFDVATGAIGLYAGSEPIKSLVAVPIAMPSLENKIASAVHGVLMCDSLQPEGFSNQHVKLLEQVATLTSRLIYWALSTSYETPGETSWDFFIQKTHDLGDAIGAASIEIIRVRIDSFTDLASSCGVSSAVRITEQFVRLTQQALPPHFPLVKMPNGDILIAVDNMMSSFFENKLRTLSQHISATHKPLSVTFDSFTARLGAHGRCNIDATLNQTPTLRKSSSTIGGKRA